jgi:hypothetical protein
LGPYITKEIEGHYNRYMGFVSVASNKCYCHFWWREVQWCQAEKEKKASQHVKYLISRCHIVRVQLFAINFGGHTEKMIIPFCPPDVEERRIKTRESPRIKINGRRGRDPI